MGTKVAVIPREEWG